MYKLNVHTFFPLDFTFELDCIRKAFSSTQGHRH